MSKKHILLSGAIAALSMGSAFAADLPSRAPPPTYVAPAPIFTWNGFYAGINAGAVFRTNYNLASNYSFYNYSSPNNVGFIGGGQIGYNWSTGPIVFGLEADADYRSSLGTYSNGLLGSGNGNAGLLGTARARLGYSFANSWLIYATGGLAYGTPFAGTTYNGFGLAPFAFNPGSNALRLGYAVGGGLEYMISPSWSIKAEYQYVDLGRVSNNFAAYGYTGFRSSAHTARLGLNYHFNTNYASPVVAKY